MIQPPTDNLYKFMAIFGLILWVAGVLYPWSKAYELELELLEVEAQVEAYEAEGKARNDPALNKSIKKIRLMFKASLAYFVFGLISVGLGGYLMAVGFKLWYQRVQKPLDERLRNETNVA